MASPNLNGKDQTLNTTYIYKKLHSIQILALIYKISFYFLGIVSTHLLYSIYFCRHIIQLQTLSTKFLGRSGYYFSKYSVKYTGCEKVTFQHFHNYCTCIRLNNGVACPFFKCESGKLDSGKFCFFSSIVKQNFNGRQLVIKMIAYANQ